MNIFDKVKSAIRKKLDENLERRKVAEAESIERKAKERKKKNT